MQQCPSSLQAEQHFGFSESVAWVVVQPGRRVTFSMKQTRNDEAEAGTKRTMQSRRKAAVMRRITEL
jgi:hypothetical protein